MVLVKKNNYVFAADNNIFAGNITAYKDEIKADINISMNTNPKEYIISTTKGESTKESISGHYRNKIPDHTHWNVVENIKRCKSEKEKTMNRAQVNIHCGKIHPFHRLTSIKGDLREKIPLSWNTRDKEFLKEYYIGLARL